MPIYDFECRECGHREELLRKLTDASVFECPHCHKESFHKCLSAPHFQLTGTGWYVTDFKNNAQPAKKESESVRDNTEKTENNTKTDSPSSVPTIKSEPEKPASGSSSSQKVVASSSGTS